MSVRGWIAAATSLAAAAIAGVAVVAGAFVVVFTGGGVGPADAACRNPVPAARPAPAGQFGKWDARQVGNAAAIVAEGRRNNVPLRGVVIAVATAMQESTLHNYGHRGARNDHDSQGLFQQRPSQGWGTVQQVRTPAYAAGKFYDRLLQVRGWQGMTLTQAAQKVQRSAFPDAYAKWETDAEVLVAHLAGLPSVAAAGAGPPGAECGDQPPAGRDDLPVPGASGWVNPVKATVGSPFGPRGGRLHAGVDLIAARHTPIRAATAGKVIRIRCNSSSGTCDRDGSPSVRGCGWYVEVRHAGNVVTRYCHMVTRPRVEVGQVVQAGQLLGNVGSSGGSSGPHLHYEVHTGVGPGGYVGSGNAVNPVAFHRRLGVPLGRGSATR